MTDPQRSQSTVIIGGGLAGLTAALVAKAQGDTVYLVERAAAIGHQWQTIHSPTGEAFTQGVRIPEVSAIPELDALLFGNLHNGKWDVFQTALKEGSIFNNTLSHVCGCIDAALLPDDPFHAGLFQLLQSNTAPTAMHPSWQNAAQQIQDIYGHTWADTLYRPLMKKYTGLDLENSAVNAYKTFIPQRHRIGDKVLSDRLRSTPLWAQKIAHTTWVDIGNSFGDRFAYPLHGESDSWVDGLVEKARAMGIHLLTEHQLIQLKTQGDTVTHAVLKPLATTNATPFDLPVDRFVWTLPTVMLYPMLQWTYQGTKPPMRDLALIYLTVDGPVGTDTFYVTDYDANNTLFRVTFLNNLVGDVPKRPGPNRVVAEVYGEWNTPEERVAMTAQVKAELNRYGLIPNDAPITFERTDVMKNFRPMYTPQTWAETETAYHQVQNNLSNVLLTGRASLTAYLAPQVFREVYQVLCDSSPQPLRIPAVA